MEGGLYQTLTKQSTPKKDLSAAQKKELRTKLSEIEDSNTVFAIMSLIIEHAKATGESMPPYMMKTVGEDSEIDIKNLPRELRWILWKFVGILSKK